MSRVTVVSLDDHEAISTGLKVLLAEQEGVEFIGATTQAAMLAPMIARLRPDVVLLDLFLGQDPTWLTCREVADTAEGPAVVIYSGYGNAQLLDRAMAAGASGYVLKDTPVADLSSILRTVREGRCYWDPSLHRQWKSARARARSTIFPERELEIIALIAEGLDNFAIAERLHISHHTVKFHIGKALTRTGEATRAGLVRVAMAEHVVST